MKRLQALAKVLKQSGMRVVVVAGDKTPGQSFVEKLLSESGDSVVRARAYLAIYETAMAVFPKFNGKALRGEAMYDAAKEKLSELAAKYGGSLVSCYRVKADKRFGLRPDQAQFQIYAANRDRITVSYNLKTDEDGKFDAKETVDQFKLGYESAKKTVGAANTVDTKKVEAAFDDFIRAAEKVCAVSGEFGTPDSLFRALTSGDYRLVTTTSHK